MAPIHHMPTPERTRSLRERLLGPRLNVFEGSSHGGIDSSVIRKRILEPEWTLDRGAGYYDKERLKRKLPCLVETGRCGMAAPTAASLNGTCS